MISPLKAQKKHVQTRKTRTVRDIEKEVDVSDGFFRTDRSVQHFTDLGVIRRHRGFEDQRVQELRIGE